MEEEIDALEYFRNNSHKAPERINAELYGLSNMGKVFHPTWDQAKTTYEAYYKSNNQKYDENSLKKLYNMSSDNFKRYSKNEFNADQSILVNPYSIQAENSGWPQMFTKTQATNNERDLLKDTGFDLSNDLDAHNNGMSLYNTIASSRLHNESPNSAYVKNEDSWEIAKENFKKNGLIYEKDETTGEIKLDNEGIPVTKRVNPEEYDFSFAGLFGKAGDSSWELHFDPNGKPVVVTVDGKNDLYKNADVRSIWSVSSMSSDGGSLPVTLARIFPNVIANIVDTTAFTADFLAGNTLDNKKDEDSWTKTAKMFANNLRSNKNLDQNGDFFSSLPTAVASIGQGVESLIPVVALAATGVGAPVALGYTGLEAAKGAYSEARNGGFTERESSLFATVLGTAAASSGMIFQGAWLNKIAAKVGSKFAEKAGFNELSKAILKKTQEKLAGATTVEAREQIIKATLKEEIPSLTNTMMAKTKDLYNKVNKFREESWIAGTILNTEGLEELAEYTVEVPLKKFFREEVFDNDLYKDLGWEPVNREKRYVDAMRNKSSSFAEKSWEDILKEGAEIFTSSQITGGLTMGYFNYRNRDEFKNKVQDGLIYESILKGKDKEIDIESKNQLELVKAGKSSLGNNRLDVNGEIVDTSKEDWYKETEAYSLWKLTDDKITALKKTRDSINGMKIGAPGVREMFKIDDLSLQARALKLFSDINSKQLDLQKSLTRDRSKSLTEEYGNTKEFQELFTGKEDLLKDIFGSGVILPKQDLDFNALTEKVIGNNKEYYKAKSEIAELNYYKANMDLAKIDKLEEINKKLANANSAINTITNIDSKDQDIINKIIEIEGLRRKFSGVLNGETIKKSIQELYFKDYSKSANAKIEAFEEIKAVQNALLTKAKAEQNVLKEKLEKGDTSVQSELVKKNEEVDELMYNVEKLNIAIEVSKSLKEFTTNDNDVASINIEKYFEENRLRRQKMILSKEEVDALDKQFKTDAKDIKEAISNSIKLIESKIDASEEFEKTKENALINLIHEVSELYKGIGNPVQIKEIFTDYYIYETGLEDYVDLNELEIDQSIKDEFNSLLTQLNVISRQVNPFYEEISKLTQQYFIINTPFLMYSVDKINSNIVHLDKSNFSFVDKISKKVPLQDIFKGYKTIIDALDFKEIAYNKKLADITNINTLIKNKDKYSIEYTNHYLGGFDLDHFQLANILVSTDGMSNTDERITNIFDAFVKTINQEEDFITQSATDNKLSTIGKDIKDNLFRASLNMELMPKLQEVLGENQDMYVIDNASYMVSSKKLINNLKNMEEILNYTRNIGNARDKKDNEISSKKIFKVLNLFKFLVDPTVDGKNNVFNLQEFMSAADFTAFKEEVDKITIPELDAITSDPVGENFKLLVKIEQLLLKSIEEKKLNEYLDKHYTNEISPTRKNQTYNNLPRQSVSYLFSLQGLRDGQVESKLFDYLSTATSFTSSIEQLLVVREVVGGMLNNFIPKDTTINKDEFHSYSFTTFIKGLAGTGKTAMVAKLIVDTYMKLANVLPEEVAVYAYNNNQLNSLNDGLTDIYKQFTEDSIDNIDTLIELVNSANAPKLIVIDEVTITPSSDQAKSDKIRILMESIKNRNVKEGKNIKLVVLGDSSQLVPKISLDSTSKNAGLRMLNSGLFANYDRRGWFDNSNVFVSMQYTDPIEQVFRTGYQVHDFLDTNLVEQVTKVGVNSDSPLALPFNMKYKENEGVEYTLNEVDLFRKFIEAVDKESDVTKPVKSIALILESNEGIEAFKSYANTLPNGKKYLDLIRIEPTNAEERKKEMSLPSINKSISVINVDKAQGSQVDLVFVSVNPKRLEQNKIIDNNLVKRVMRTAASRRKQYVNIHLANSTITSEETKDPLIKYVNAGDKDISARNKEKKELFANFNNQTKQKADTKKSAEKAKESQTNNDSEIDAMIKSGYSNKDTSKQKIEIPVKLC